MLESLEYTARIRSTAVHPDGDDLPEDMHHDYTLHFDGKGIDLNARDDRGVIKRIPLTASDIEKMSEAVDTFRRLQEVGGAA